MLNRKQKEQYARFKENATHFAFLDRGENKRGNGRFEDIKEENRACSSLRAVITYSTRQDKGAEIAQARFYKAQRRDKRLREEGRSKPMGDAVIRVTKKRQL